ncbi:protein vestigial isoform X2 [Anthonomus grandis grandis]|uniref:protein vestigial isoform X2 n=1 Tax=Anthonomus grandis grandis TaxID=2921223 RepID=UPI00216613BC|nr:protein vestigial isoform X2 [Anthonomus grandis grandis]
MGDELKVALAMEVKQEEVDYHDSVVPIDGEGDCGESTFNWNCLLSFNVQRLQDAHTLSSQAASSAAAAASSAVATAASVGAGGVLGDAHPLAAHHHHPIYLQGSAHSSGGSVSSAGGGSPTSPLRPGKEEECSLHGRSSTDERQPGVEDDDDSQDGSSSRAQYVSANCVVFTHYQGDAASVVDEHFNRALDKTTHTKDSSPMSTRNFPPSFWNSQHYGGAGGGGHHGTSATDLYSDHYHPGDAWYQYSQHHRAVHDYHHHNMAAQYGGLLLPGSRLHMSSHAPCKAMDWQHPSIESAYSSYPTMSGLEAQVQDSSKDLYWF